MKNQFCIKKNEIKNSYDRIGMLPIQKIEDDHYVSEKQKYFLYFPLDWITTMAAGSGPKFCENCKKHGIVDDIFIGFCSDCAIYTYDNKRGHGFINGVEDLNMVEKETSASYTYLKYSKYAFPIDNINKKPLDLNKLLDKRKNSFHEISELISEKTRSKSSETSNDTRSTSVNSELSFRLSD